MRFQRGNSLGLGLQLPNDWEGAGVFRALWGRLPPLEL